MMSDLSHIEKRKLERLLRMGGGYVLDFSNRTFEEFVRDSSGLCIYDARYDYDSGSKANRLRAFWSIEPNHVVGRLLNDLLDLCSLDGVAESARPLVEDCQRIVDRLDQGALVSEIEAISPNSASKDFEILAKSVRKSIEKNEPEAGLDRLHTFVVKYVRVLCKQRSIDTPKEKPLHSMFGEYVKSLKGDGLIESQMTERILKSSISTLEAFNRVRNEQSFAHDNEILNYSESLLIFNHVSSCIRFLAAFQEPEQAEKEVQDLDPEWDDIPF